MKDLGHSMPSPEEVKPNPEKRTDYPKLCLRDKSLEKAFPDGLPKVGSEMEAELKLRVCGVREDEYGKSVEFEVMAGEFGDPSEGEDA